MVTDYMDTAEVAKLMRMRLKAVFPGVRFSVTISRFSGGSAVRVHWTDGPRTKDVEAVVAPFEGKGFDGYIDMGYSLETWILPDGSAQRAAVHGTEGSRGSVPDYATDAPHPGARLVSTSCWVSCDRRITDEAQAIAEADAYIREHCITEGNRFGNQWVSGLATGMVYGRAAGESWAGPFRRVVLREDC